MDMTVPRPSAFTGHPGKFARQSVQESRGGGEASPESGTEAQGPQISYLWRHSVPQLGWSNVRRNSVVDNGRNQRSEHSAGGSTAVMFSKIRR